MFLTQPADGSSLAPALASTRAQPAVVENGATSSDPNADFDDGPGNTPQADVSRNRLAPPLPPLCDSLIFHSRYCLHHHCQYHELFLHMIKPRDVKRAIAPPRR